MNRRRFLGRVRSIGTSLLLVLAPGCASTPSAVPLEGSTAELAALAGHWKGEYASQATGRLGSIVFDLVAGEDRAHGDVLMVPSGKSEPYRPARQAAEDKPAPADAYQLLTIRFVRAEGGRVSGTLDPYWDPDCDCEVSTTFVGDVRGDTVEGTFTSERQAGKVFGTWKATRTPK